MSNGPNALNQWLQDTIFKPLEDKKMPVMEHLAALQVRLTRAVIITAVVFVGTFFYADTLVKWLRIPLQNMFTSGSLSWVPTDLQIVTFVFLASAESICQSGRTLCPRRRVLIYTSGSLAIRRARASCAGTALCCPFCGVARGGFL